MFFYFHATLTNKKQALVRKLVPNKDPIFRNLHFDMGSCFWNRTGELRLLFEIGKRERFVFFHHKLVLRKRRIDPSWPVNRFQIKSGRSNMPFALRSISRQDVVKLYILLEYKHCGIFNMEKLLWILSDLSRGVKLWHKQ